MDRYELIPRQGKWVLRREQAKELIGKFAFKESAVKAAVDYVQGHGGFLTIKTNDGVIEQKMEFPIRLTQQPLMASPYPSCESHA